MADYTGSDPAIPILAMVENVSSVVFSANSLDIMSPDKELSGSTIDAIRDAVLNATISSFTSSGSVGETLDNAQKMWTISYMIDYDKKDRQFNLAVSLSRRGQGVVSPDSADVEIFDSAGNSVLNPGQSTSPSSSGVFTFSGSKDLDSDEDSYYAECTIVSGDDSVTKMLPIGVIDKFENQRTARGEV